MIDCWLLCWFYLVKYSDAEVEEKRQRVLQMKQFLQDNKVYVFEDKVFSETLIH